MLDCTIFRSEFNYNVRTMTSVGDAAFVRSSRRGGKFASGRTGPHQSNFDVRFFPSALRDDIGITFWSIVTFITNTERFCQCEIVINWTKVKLVLKKNSIDIIVAPRGQFGYAVPDNFSTIKIFSSSTKLLNMKMRMYELTSSFKSMEVIKGVPKTEWDFDWLPMSKYYLIMWNKEST